MDAIKARLDDLERPRTAVIVGGGFIGLEMAENLVHRGFEVTVVEMADQVLTPLDPEYGGLVAEFLEMHGVTVALDDGVAGFAQADDGTLTVSTRSGARHTADIVILALGVRPETTLARMAGIDIGELGGIRVDQHMRTSDPDIFAVGDAVEVRDFVTGEWSLIALAGPANRQARIAADVIAGRDSRFRGTQGTAVVGLFGSTVAWTGANEKTLQRLGDTDYEKAYIYPNSHAGYYPGAKPIAMKVLFRRSDGRVLGAQAVGEDGVDKRISVIALAIQMGATVYDLEECELCYAPPFGSAKDPVNFAGMVAAGVLRGDMPLTHWGALGDGFLLDVRETFELAVEQVPDALNIPMGELRSRLDELPRDREVLVICRSGQRAYTATRCLLQNGFAARVVSGGMLSHAILAMA
jgi:NADPH-dependent 2,4-dienoyl-CoA reductase/sulfur reductase-like enzyme/rhodanese-related sulfurtransferase